eukprot:TCALIF_03072-PA protein Name:"Protein of unknown function" AED:0.90 eAED:0.90 QI:0/0/0/0.25/1/1/4/0/106
MPKALKNERQLYYRAWHFSLHSLASLESLKAGLGVVNVLNGADTSRAASMLSLQPFTASSDEEPASTVLIRYNESALQCLRKDPNLFPKPPPFLNNTSYLSDSCAA